MEDVSSTECQSTNRRNVKSNFHDALLCEPFPSHQLTTYQDENPPKQKAKKL